MTYSICNKRTKELELYIRNGVNNRSINVVQALHGGGALVNLNANSCQAFLMPPLFTIYTSYSSLSTCT